MQDVALVGIDLGMPSFNLHGQDGGGKAVFLVRASIYGRPRIPIPRFSMARHRRRRLRFARRVAASRAASSQNVRGTLC
jgi:hypothetical protein